MWLHIIFKLDSNANAGRELPLVLQTRDHAAGQSARQRRRHVVHASLVAEEKLLETVTVLQQVRQVLQEEDFAV